MHPPHRPSLPLVVTLLLGVCLVGCGDDGVAPGSDASPDAGQPDCRGNHESWDFPALATRADGDVFVAYQHWLDGKDAVEVDLLTAFGEAPVVAHASATRVLGTAAAVDASEALHVVFSEQEPDRSWRLAEVVLPSAGAGALGAPSAATTLAGGDGAKALQPCLARDASGRLLLAWQELRDGGMTIRARAFAAGRWGAPATISVPGPSAWAPDVVATGDGAFALAWDAAHDGDYDILLARLSVDDAGAVALVSRARVTDSPRFEAWPSLATAGDRLYVAYETGPERWGREGSENKLEIALHTQRSLEIVAVEGERVAPLAHPFREGLNEALQDSVERPHIRVDGGGNLLLLFRGLPLPGALDDPDDPDFRKRERASGGGGKGWRTSIWFTYWSRYDGSEWTAPVGFEVRHHVGLDGSNGRCDAPCAVGELVKGGSAYAVVGDARDRETAEDADLAVAWWRPVSGEPTRVATGRIGKGVDVPPPALGAWRALPAPRDEVDAAPFRPRLELADGSALTLALGDLHRHTDLSRCSSNWDGPITDAIRYALDVGELQYLAVTDHFEHMNLSDWWREIAYMDAYDSPGRMALLRGYERADNQTGHRNVIARGDDLPLVGYRKQYAPGRDDLLADAPPDLFRELTGREVITIPHTPAGMSSANPASLEWLSFEPGFDRLVEIFQGYRGSSEALGAPRLVPGSQEGHYVVDGLDGGLHFGLIASSDHQSSDGAFAGAWVTGTTRAEVYDALFARRTFAATTRMALWAEWDGVPMGTSARAPAGPTRGLDVDVELADGELHLVELIVDGKVVDERPASGRRLHAHFEGPFLDVPAEGERYAYVRVRTASVPPELGWTSPVRLGAGDAWHGPDGLRGCEAFPEKSVGKALELRTPFGTRWHSCCVDDPPPQPDVPPPPPAARDDEGAVLRDDGR